METEISNLKRKISHLEGKLLISQKQNIELKEALKNFSSDTEKAGLIGESILEKIIKVKPTNGNQSYDFITANGVKLEVKYSNISQPTPSSNTNRWSWTKIYGTSGKKEYDRLILIGKKDDQLIKKLEKNGSEYFIFFDIPYSQVGSLVYKASIAGSMIRITTNPDSVRSKIAKKLYSEFMVDVKTLKARYAKKK